MGVTNSDKVLNDLMTILYEEVKAPLVNIVQLSELDNKNKIINAKAKKALRTLDNINLYKKVSSSQIALKLEPVHVGGTINEVANELEPLMRSAGCRLNVEIQGSIGAADTDKQVLKGALQSLCQGLLDTVNKPSDIVFTARKIPTGLRVSVLSDAVCFDSVKVSFKNANYSSSQPINSIAGAAADILTAREMFSLLGADLGKTSQKNLQGFGATLNISKQLSMV